MVTEERLPPACAFAASVLAENDTDPEAVPEEAVEAAQQHMATCERCLNAQQMTATRKRKRVRRNSSDSQRTGQLVLDQPGEKTPFPSIDRPEAQAFQGMGPLTPQPALSEQLALLDTTTLNCQQCRGMLKEYAEALDNGQNVAELYPAMHDHLLTCESGCLVLLDLFRQEVKSTRKYRRRTVHDPFSIIGWEASGFFRGGQLPVSPMALSYGTLILLLLVASFSTFIGISWDNARFYQPSTVTLPTPDGIGFSDGLKVYDACNANGFRDKSAAAQSLQSGDLAQAHALLASAVSSTVNDTTGCNGAEAAIYLEDLQVRQSGHPYGLVVVSFDSGPGDANPHGGTDRHVLYAASTQELVGAYIAQQQYNLTQMKITGAPLLYLILANTTGIEQGAAQVAEMSASLSHGSASPQSMGLLTTLSVGKTHPVLGVLGLGPSTLVTSAMPVLCRAGLPLISPTSTSLFVLSLLTSTSLYKHCAPGFAFVRFSADDYSQSATGAVFAEQNLHVHNAAIFYDPTDPSSEEAAHSFSDTFIKSGHGKIVAQETAVASGITGTNSHPGTTSDILLADLKDALDVHTPYTRPQLIYAALLTDDVVALAQAIAHLPQNQQPILMVGGEHVETSSLLGLVQWTRQQQLSLPRIFVTMSSATRPPTQSWPRQFYASFCTSFAAPGNYCSGAAALDQGALFFGDGIELLANTVGPLASDTGYPSAEELVKRISQASFIGVSAPIALHVQNLVVVVNSKAQPVVLGIQGDGSLQIVG